MRYVTNISFKLYTVKNMDGEAGEELKLIIGRHSR